MQSGAQVTVGAVAGAVCVVAAAAFVSTSMTTTSAAAPVVARAAIATPASPPPTTVPVSEPLEPEAPEATAAPATTTTTVPAPTTTVFEPDRQCAALVGRAGTLESFAAAARVDVDLSALWFENDGRESVEPGDLVDVCVGNGVDDLTGDPSPEFELDPETGAAEVEVIAAALLNNVERQQEHLNGLFADYGTVPLTVDGDSGPRTRQRLCAARLAFGMETSTTDLMPGTAESVALMGAAELPPFEHSITESSRWSLIDRTCQMMFVGEGDQMVFAFNTSTGEEGYGTRDQDRSRVFRYNPALDNGGWHDSTDFPVGVDNPLNGNLFKPLYFDNGQAIHGAGVVPHYPASKGCARLRVTDQQALVNWLGLGGIEGELWQARRINFDVSVQGTWNPTS